MMTPEEARCLIKADSGSTHGPQADCHSCKAVKQHAWQMTHQIAGMHYEYGVRDANGGIVWMVEHHVVDGDSYTDACDYLETFEAGDAHLVRRLVSQPEEVKP